MNSLSEMWQCQNGDCHLRIAVEEFKPWLTIHNDSTTGVGPMITMVEYIMKSLNMSYTLQRPADHKLGRFVNGNWTGMVGMLQNNEVDLATGPLTATYNRSQVVGFSQFLEMDYDHLLLWQHDKTKETDLFYLEAFTLDVWVAWTLTVALVSFLESIYKTPRITWYMYLDQVWKIGVIQVFQVPDACRKTRNRVMLVFWLLGSFLMARVFSERLVSLLAGKSEVHSVRKLQDLLLYPEVELISFKGTIYEHYLRVNEDLDINKLWVKMQRTKDTSSITVSSLNDISLLDKIARREAALFTDYYSVLQMLTTEIEKGIPCHFHAFTEKIYSTTSAMAWRKDLSKTLKEGINSRIARLVETGTVSYLVERAARSAYQCLELEPGDDGLAPLTFAALEGVFFCVALSFLFAAFGLLFEIDKSGTLGFFCKAKK